MNKTIATALALSIWTSSADLASAQPALKKLEELIRSQRGSVAPDDSAKPPAATDPEMEGETREGPRKGTREDGFWKEGYLGLVADDQKDRGRGVRILEVLPGGPADRAGLRPQDLITAAGGIRVRQMANMAAVLAGIPVGGELTFEILRGEERHEIEVTFGRRPPPEQRLLGDVPPPAVGAPAPALQPPIVQPIDVAAPPAAAPEDAGAGIDALKRRIEELEERVEQLERALARLTGAASREEDRPIATPVAVTVTFQGQPVEGAVVMFAPRAAPGRPASGKTEADGKVMLTTFDRGDGAVPGTYRVTISKTHVDEPGPQAEPRHLLPLEYASPETSALMAEVVAAGPNEFAFELTH
jgi:hypothetical protein